ncbi:LysR family transcriptional regulator [Paraferrimonas haliotis]|uniref:LysR family transcriptional regulator n=1 Tax=Paraferrimonas haliotis TaxID=2013866 RepID=A0AA37WY49_9GAMM|nr:LysR family transcriptional regulator [Paraferrimonas haliotis]GLS84947.1 LysR family transcriptional regulator [Paraferrimonas haliotis]
MNYSFDQLQAFITSVEQGSFKKAAMLLGKHATTVSQQVAMLEIDTDLTLFDRKVRKLVLTESGAGFYKYAKPVLNELEQLHAKVTSMTALAPQQLRVGIENTVRHNDLLNCAKLTQAAFPGLQLSIHSGDPLQLVEQLTQHQIDVAVSNTVFQQFSGVDNNPTFNFELAWIASKSWLGGESTIDSNQLRQHTQLVYQYVNQSPQLAGHIYSNHTMSVQTLEDIVELVGLDCGWAIVPKYRVQPWLERGEVSIFQPSDIKPVYWYAEVFTLPNSEQNPAIQHFVEHVKELADR